MSAKKSAAVKKPTIRKTAPGPKPANVEKAPRTPRKPAVERAAKLATLATKKVAALTRMTVKWHGEATPAQQSACVRIAANLGSVEGFINQIAADTAFLKDSGFTPAGGSAGRKAIAVGTRVKIKNAKFDAEVHGEDNDFEVVGTTEKYVRIQGVANSNLEIPVLRAWIEPVVLPADAEPADTGDDAA